MKRTATLLVSLAVSGLFPIPARTGGSGGTNDVAITSVTTGTGYINLNGSYTLDSGYELSVIVLMARPAGGTAGEGFEATTVGFPTTITADPGTYDVQAVMEAFDGDGNVHYYFSTTWENVTVPSK